MSTEVQVVELPKELQEVQTLNLGLAKEKAEEHLAAFVPFVSTMTELKQKTESINFTDPSTEDAKLAREIRLAMAKNRVSSEKEKDARKKGLLTEGNLIQAAYNVVANASKMIEESLGNVEKYEEIKRQKAIQAKQEERHAELVDYGFALPENLGEMSDEVYSSFKTGILAQAKAKQEAEEAQRQAEERVQAQNKLRTHRATLLRPLWNFMNDDELDLDLAEMNEDQFKNLSDVLEQRSADHQAEQKRLADELQAEKDRAALISKRREERSKQLIEIGLIYNGEEFIFEDVNIHHMELITLDEKNWDELIQRVTPVIAERKAELKAQQEAEKAEAERIRKAKEDAEAELKRKEEQEAKEKAEAEAKAKQEEKERKAAERKAKNASDAQKLQTYLAGISTVELPSAKTEDGQAAVEEILKGLVTFQNLIKSKIEGL